MITKCIFPAAGYGTRFLPATKSMPKEMLPILHKPLIEYGVEEAVNSGMKDICIVTGRGKRTIEDYFDINYELEKKIKGTSNEEKLYPIRNIINNCTFSYIRQRNMHGLGDAVLTAKPIVDAVPFGVILADDLCVNELNTSNIMQEMIKIYEQYECSIIAVMQVPDNEVHKYGIVSGKNINDSIMEINSILEKPSIYEASSNWAVVGRYILTPDIFDILKNTKAGVNGEVQLTDAISQQLKSKKVIAYKFKGIRFDCGSIDGFVAATNYFYQKSKKQQRNQQNNYNLSETT